MAASLSAAGVARARKLRAFLDVTNATPRTDHRHSVSRANQRVRPHPHQPSTEVAHHRWRQAA